MEQPIIPAVSKLFANKLFSPIIFLKSFEFNLCLLMSVFLIKNLLFKAKIKINISNNRV